MVYNYIYYSLNSSSSHHRHHHHHRHHVSFPLCLLGGGSGSMSYIIKAKQKRCSKLSSLSLCSLSPLSPSLSYLSLSPPSLLPSHHAYMYWILEFLFILTGVVMLELWSSCSLLLLLLFSLPKLCDFFIPPPPPPPPPLLLPPLLLLLSTLTSIRSW